MWRVPSGPKSWGLAGGGRHVRSGTRHRAHWTAFPGDAQWLHPTPVLTPVWGLPASRVRSGPRWVSWGHTCCPSLPGRPYGGTRRFGSRAGCLAKVWAPFSAECWGLRAGAPLSVLQESLEGGGLLRLLRGPVWGGRGRWPVGCFQLYCCCSTGAGQETPAHPTLWPHLAVGPPT